MTLPNGISNSTDDPTVDEGGELAVAPALILPTGLDNQREASSFGDLGRPFDRRTPFFAGLTGAFGVALAYLTVRGVADVASVLVIIGLSLFIAIGLNPILEWLCRRGLSRAGAAGLVTFIFLLAAAGFIAAAVFPIAREAHNLAVNFPRYRHEIVAGHGWLGRAAARLHLTSYLTGKTALHVPPTAGVLGAGKVLLSVGVGTVSVIALTIYFLIALPDAKRLWFGLVPRSRRDRVELLTEETFGRVGGFMLGNLLTSFVSGAGTYLWLVSFGVPYPLLLGLFVAFFDLIPMVGSTVAGVVVSLVALSRGLPVAIGTAAFYIAYRFLEDYLLNPRVMKHTVHVSPGLTILATLIGGALLGIIGALVAIPVAATVELLIEEVVVPRQSAR